ncbi:hypothetical protein G6F62_015062 [Rhizopus arrhizus]|nr:hypothetical protein G6F62_015062 [Rhizopus arrhizus]
MLLERLNIDAQGSVSNLRLAAQTRNDMGAIELQGSVRQQGAQWRGELASLRIAPVKGDAWSLRAPAAFAINGSTYTLSEACLAAASMMRCRWRWCSRGCRRSPRSEERRGG